MRFLPLFLFVFIFACNKDNEETSIKDQLTDRTWTKFEELTAPAGTTNFTKLSDLCQDDNPWTFKTDNSYLFTEGVVLCEPDDPALDINGTYLLDESSMTIQLDPDFDDTVWNIITIKEDTLLLEGILSQSFVNRILLMR